jgi:predicted GIY-YIG superfamily endonuclease
MALRGLQNLEHGVYRVYDADQLLLYVGVSVDPDGRLKAHSHGAEWVPDHASHTVTWYLTRAAALAAETRAIRQEHPVYNVTGSVCRCGGYCGICSSWAVFPVLRHQCPSVWFSYRGKRLMVPWPPAQGALARLTDEIDLAS